VWAHDDFACGLARQFADLEYQSVSAANRLRKFALGDHSFAGRFPAGYEAAVFEIARTFLATASGG